MSDVKTKISHFFLKVNVIFTVILVCWLVFNYYIMAPIIEKYQTTEITTFSGHLLQSLGILIGLSGLSAFYYFGKISDLSSKLHSQMAEAINLENANNLKLRHIVNRIRKIEVKAISAKCSKELVTDIKKSIKSLQDHVRVSENSDMLKDVNKQTKDFISTISKFGTRDSIITISCFAVSLILTLIFELTLTPYYLQQAIIALGLGAIFILYDINSQNAVLVRYNQLLGGYHRLIGDMTNGTLYFKAPIEELELSYEIDVDQRKGE